MYGDHPAGKHSDREFLGGRILIAMPGIDDSRFDRSILLICEHTDEMAMAIALNRPVDGLTLPKDTSLRASTGNVYIDGLVDSDRWVLDTAQGQTVHIDSFDLSEATLALDGERKLHEIKRGVLSKDATLGTLHHAAGTSIRYNPRHLRNDYPGAWLIIPPLPAADAPPVPSHDIVQGRDGKVLSSPAD